MAKEIKIPQISEGVDTATVAEIMVSKGDHIEKEQSVIAVETDKATADVPSTASGTVKEIKVSEGDEVNVGDTVIILEDEEGEDSENQKEAEPNEKENKKDKKSDKKKDSDSKKKEKKSESRKEKEDDSDNKQKKSSEKKSDREDKKDKSDKKSSSKEVYASPGVRRLARELEININEVKGSGEDGRITKKDLKSHESGDKKRHTADLPELPDFSKWGAIEKKKLNKIKKITARNVTTSWQSIPHVFQFGEADISNIEDYIEKHQEQIEEAGGKLTITAILTKIVAMALRQFPSFNASVDMKNEEIILKKYVNISIAVATDKGLLVPVLREVDKKSVKELSLEISEIAEKARDQELSKEELEGGNFSISNLGGIGGTNFTPIIYHPQVAILGVSQVDKKAVYIDGEFEARSILPLSLSYDHRVIDGAEGAAFMDWIVKALEDPYEALLY